MPGMYPEGEYDLAGFCVGVVERKRIISGRSIRAGDVLLGLAASGAHSNGYSLIRRILEREAPDAALTDAIMQPTRIYVRSILQLLRTVSVKGLAHITGGGLVGNVPRALPPRTRAVIDARAWKRPALFEWLQEKGGVAEAEMHRVFNCGIGMVVVVAADDAQRAAKRLRTLGETVYEIGVIEKTRGEPEAVIS
jgi:phosphoribosylformylglycinamidine cyclo-ligase